MDNGNNNFKNKQDNPQIIGFNQLTGQPIFNSGIESKNQANTKEKKIIEQKKVSKGKFILHIALSFGLWNLIISFVFNLLMSSVINKIFGSNLIIYILIYNILWILSSVCQIFITYWFNKFKTVEEYQLRSAKNIVLILFYIFIIYLNRANISYLMDYNMILQSVMLVIHVVVIWLVNNKVFYKYWGRYVF